MATRHKQSSTTNRITTISSVRKNPMELIKDRSKQRMSIKGKPEGTIYTYVPEIPMQRKGLTMF